MSLQERDDPDPNRRETPREQVNRGLNALTDEVFRERAPYENEGPRDTFWLRWLKFMSVVFALPLLCGLGFLYADLGFLIGAAFGLVLALIYVVRCIVKGIDP